LKQGFSGRSPALRDGNGVTHRCEFADSSADVTGSARPCRLERPPQMSGASPSQPPVPSTATAAG